MKHSRFIILITALLLLFLSAACSQSEAEAPTTDLGVVYRSPT